MIIDCISDLHGEFPPLDSGDLLIIAGDLTGRNELAEYFVFRDWLSKQKYTKKVFIAGNRDGLIASGHFYFSNEWIGADYLRDSGTEFGGLKIWGSPWTRRFDGESPDRLAFTCETEEELAEKWALIPDDTDILITHSPPWGVLDRAAWGGSLGSLSLQKEIFAFKPKLKLMVFGHLHESYGQFRDTKTLFINAAHTNRSYEPVNEPIRVIY
jgi:Icc-related predicted phosphoesterase